MKAAAAVAAVEEIESGMVLGLGTGSTAAHAVREIGSRLKAGRIDRIVAIPTSVATEKLAIELGIQLIAPGEAAIDLAIDGADEIDPNLALIKGGGGALLREKVIAASAGRFVVISDDSKVVATLGSTFDLPLEVAQYGLAITTTAVADFGAPKLRCGDDESPFITDNGNYVIDLAVDPIADPAGMDAALHQVPGVLATGLFVAIADAAYVSGGSGVRRIDSASPITTEGV